MPIFKYVAIDKSGVIQSGELEVASKEAVLDFLKSEGLKAVSVRERKKFFPVRFLFFRRVKSQELIAFVEELGVMLSAGVPLPEAIEVLAHDETNPELKRILSSLKFGLESGEQISEVLSRFPHIFSQIFIGLIRAGEKSGNLAQSLNYILISLKKEQRLISHLKSALIYPIILILAILAVLVLLFTLVLPKIVTVFQEAQLTLPLSTKILVIISQIMGAKPFITILVILAFGFLLFVLFKNKKVKNLFILILAKLPLFSSLVQKIDLARFCRSLSSLLKNGIPIVESLNLTSQTLSSHYRKAAIRVSEEVKKGISLANTLRRDPALFPRLLISMLSVGEKTGKTDQILFDLAKFYEREVDQTLKNLVSLIEPLLLLVVGLVIGGIALSIVVPIYQLISRLGG